VRVYDPTEMIDQRLPDRELRWVT